MSIRDKYNKTNTEKVHKTAAELLLEKDAVNTEKQDTVDTEGSNEKKERKKMQFVKPVKATFLIEEDLHAELKKAAADEKRKLSEVAGDALVMYFETTRGYKRNN